MLFIKFSRGVKKVTGTVVYTVWARSVTKALRLVLALGSGSGLQLHNV